MMRIKITTLFLFLTISSVKAQNRETIYKDSFGLIEAWLSAQVAYENIPGISAIIVRDQEILWSGAFGKSNLEESIDFNPSTACSICSITKTFTAVAVMKMVDEGKLNLDDKVKDILPFFEVYQNYPEGGAITVRSLLSHSSGLPRDTGHGYWSSPDFPFPTKFELISKMKELETERPVNADLNYSNLGYAILGQIVEEVSGISYEDYIKTHIFDPLRMSNSSIGIEDTLYGNKHAIGYTALKRNRDRERASRFRTRAMSPAAGISTTVLDLAKYASWQFRLQDATTSEILRPSTIKDMHSIQSSSKDGYRNWGYGFEVFTSADGNRWVSHGGICPGYVSYLQMDLTNKLAYIITINTNGIQARKYLKGMRDIMHQTSNKAEDSKGLIVDLLEYAGNYDLTPWNSEYTISVVSNNLIIMYLPTNTLNPQVFKLKESKKVLK